MPDSTTSAKLEAIRATLGEPPVRQGSDFTDNAVLSAWISNRGDTTSNLREYATLIALAHPATFRRFGFALVEQHAEFEPTWSNYGYTEHVRVDSNPDTIFIPGAQQGETPETAREAVFRAASSLLNEFFETETRGGD